MVRRRVMITGWYERIICIIFTLFFVLSLSNACTPKKFYVDKYGFDIDAFSRLVNDVNKNRGGDIIFPSGKTFIIRIRNDFNSGHRRLPQDASIVMNFKHCKKVNVNMNGSTIVIEANHSTKYAAFMFFDCESFYLHNGKIIGDAIDHNYTPVSYNGNVENSTHEWCHGVMVMGAHGKIQDMDISYMPGDGVYVSGYKDKEELLHSEVEIKKSTVSYCRRNGVSCASTKGFALQDSHIHHIGTYNGLMGTSPQAGIDFEYEDNVGDTGNIIINNCSFEECTRNTVTSSNTSPPNPQVIKISNSTFEGSGFQIANIDSKEKRVENCMFVEAPINCGETYMEGCLFKIGSHVNYVNGTTFKNCQFVGNVKNPSQPYGSCLLGYSLKPCLFENCSFKNIRGLNNSSASHQGFACYNYPLVATFSHCNFSNCSFVKGNPKHESSLCFENCTLADGCMIYNMGGTAINFIKSKIDNVESYPAQTGEFVFDGCEIIQNDENVKNPLIYFGTHSIKNTKVKNTISISPEMKAKGVCGIKYKK